MWVFKILDTAYIGVNDGAFQPLPAGHVITIYESINKLLQVDPARLLIMLTIIALIDK